MWLRILLCSAYAISLNAVDLFVKSMHPHLHFVAERITEKNSETWRSFVEKQRDEASVLLSIADRLPPIIEKRLARLKADRAYYVDEGDKSSEVEFQKELVQLENFLAVRLREYRPTPFHEHLVKSYAIINATADPLERMRRCISFFETAQVYVIYATQKVPTALFDIRDIENVEMSVALVTENNVPFTVHMGIARGVLHLKEAYKQKSTTHKALSVKLHAFAAAFARTLPGMEKRFIITTPLESMRTIFRNTLTSGLWIGFRGEGGLIEQTSTQFYRDFSFRLFDPKDHSVLFSATYENAGGYWWFFANTTPSKNFPYVVIDRKTLELHSEIPQA